MMQETPIKLYPAILFLYTNQFLHFVNIWTSLLPSNGGKVIKDLVTSFRAEGGGGDRLVNRHHTMAPARKSGWQSGGAPGELCTPEGPLVSGALRAQHFHKHTVLSWARARFGRAGWRVRHGSLVEATVYILKSWGQGGDDKGRLQGRMRHGKEKACLGATWESVVWPLQGPQWVQDKGRKLAGEE